MLATMALESSSFVKLAIPKFDGHYEHWAMLMENFLRSKEFWNLVEHGTTRVKCAQLQALQKEFEILHMKAGETVNEYFARTLTIANKRKAKHETLGDESKDIDTLTIDELQGSLLVHEQHMSSHVEEEQALQVIYGSQYGGRGQGLGSFRERGRGKQSFDKATVECYHYHKLGHFQYKCSELKKKANYVEADEEMLLMAYGICEARKQFEYDSDGKRQHKASCKWDCSNYHSATRVYLLQHNHRRFNTTLALLKWTFGVHRLKNSPTQGDGTWFAITEDFYKGVQRLFGG
ncbi:unnamed protein product [Prunus armeniaca]